MNYDSLTIGARTLWYRWICTYVFFLVGFGLGGQSSRLRADVPVCHGFEFLLSYDITLATWHGLLLNEDHRYIAYPVYVWKDTTTDEPYFYTSYLSCFANHITCTAWTNIDDVDVCTSYVTNDVVTLVTTKKMLNFASGTRAGFAHTEVSPDDWLTVACHNYGLFRMPFIGQARTNYYTDVSTNPLNKTNHICITFDPQYDWPCTWCEGGAGEFWALITVTNTGCPCLAGEGHPITLEEMGTLWTNMYGATNLTLYGGTNVGISNMAVWSGYVTNGMAGGYAGVTGGLTNLSPGSFESDEWELEFTVPGGGTAITIHMDFWNDETYGPILEWLRFWIVWSAAFATLFWAYRITMDTIDQIQQVAVPSSNAGGAFPMVSIGATKLTAIGIVMIIITVTGVFVAFIEANGSLWTVLSVALYSAGNPLVPPAVLKGVHWAFEMFPCAALLYDVAAYYAYYGLIRMVSVSAGIGVRFTGT